MNILQKIINNYLLNLSYKKAIKEADKEFKETGRKTFVILYDRDFMAITKKRMKLLRKSGKLKNDDLKGIENRAIYTAGKTIS